MSIPTNVTQKIITGHSSSAPFVSYAQNFEDIYLWRALRTISQGTYIDLDVKDPLLDSVSLGFYEKQWHGYHFVATTDSLAAFEQNRPHEKTYPLFTNESSIDVDSVHAAFAKLTNTPIHWMRIGGSHIQALLNIWTTSDIMPWIILISPDQINHCDIDHNNDQCYGKHDWQATLSAQGYLFACHHQGHYFYVHSAHTELIASLTPALEWTQEWVLGDSVTHPFLSKIFAKNTTSVRQLETKMRQLESRIRQVETLHMKAEARLAEIYGGRSWRITQPLRWLSAQATVLKKEGIWTRCVKFPKKLIRLFKQSQENTEKAQQTKLSQQLAQLSPIELTLYHALKAGLPTKTNASPQNPQQQKPINTQSTNQGSINKEALE